MNISGSLSFIVLLVLVQVPSGAMQRRIDEDETLSAQSRAQNLGREIGELYREHLRTQIELRRPASEDKDPLPPEGLMGQDPWGHAYNYRIENRNDGRLRIVMKSPGPNGTWDQLPGGDDIEVSLVF